MSKIYKVEMFYIDIDDNCEDVEEVKNDIRFVTDRLPGITHITDIEESKEFEWDDDININNINATRKDCEEYFK